MGKDFFIVESLKKRFVSIWNYYKGIRPNNLTSPKYRHLLLLLYWPLFGLIFLFLEKYMPSVYLFFTGNELVYTEIICELDHYIPFNELFVIPYYYWFAFLVGMVVWGVLFDVQALRHFQWFVILSYSITAVIYLFWPTMQCLRPTEFARDNFLVDIAKNLYNFDTNTNVCPSIHVLGSMAVCFAGLHSKRLRGWGWKVFFIVSALWIDVSTVFMKQHSAIDMFAGLALSAVCYVIVFYVICRKKTEIYPDEYEEPAGEVAAE